jgi:hypothetical protein
VISLALFSGLAALAWGALWLVDRLRPKAAMEGPKLVDPQRQRVPMDAIEALQNFGKHCDESAIAASHLAEVLRRVPIGAMTINDARVAEGYPPIEGGEPWLRPTKP